jgi:hypothetical protein
MSDTQIDRILSQDEIVPSSGFVGSVMDAVRQEAAAPLPIPFPWKRALPFIVLGVGALALAAIVTIIAISNLNGALTASKAPDVTSMLSVSRSSLMQGSLGSALRWCGLSLVAAFISVMLSLRLAGGES